MHRFVFFCLVLILVAASSSAADITTGLVGYWPFTGDAQDASGNGNHGTPNATATLTTDRLGYAASAYHFNGTNSWINIPSSASLESPTTAITIAAWIRRDGWGMVGQLYSPILTKSTAAANVFQYRMTTSSTGLGTSLNRWNTSHTSVYAFGLDEWYHVAATWEADTLRSYVNGSLLEKASLVTTIIPDSRTLSIGSDIPGFLKIFYGDIDEVRIYNRALSDEDIGELAGATSAVPITFGTGAGIELGRAYTNPLSVSAAIPFTLLDDSVVSLDIIDVAGRRVRTLVSGRDLQSGPHTFHWDGRDAAGRSVVGGMYLYQVSTPLGAASGKILISR